LFNVGAYGTPEAMRIDSTGNVGIGTTSPTSIGASITTTHISGAAGGGVYLSRTAATPTNGYLAAIWGEVRLSAVSAIPLTFLTTNTERMRIDSAGSVGIGTTNPTSFRLQVAGNVGPDAASTYNLGSAGLNWGCLYYNGGTLGTCASDERLKTNIEDLSFDSTSTSALDQIAGLQMHSFAYKSATSTIYHGLIAQEVEQVAPELVVTDASTTLMEVKYGDLQWLTLQALQQLVAKVTALAQTVAGFAENFTTHQLNADELCLKSTCLTQAELQALLAGHSAATPNNSAPAIDPGTTTPPLITIEGQNPATVQIGDAYTDLGALAQDSAGHDLSYRTFLNGALSGNVLIDTSAAATDTIDYVATDTWGNTATSTRKVIVEAASATDNNATDERTSSSTPPATVISETATSTATSTPLAP
jgi:hypothetical protein